MPRPRSTASRGVASNAPRLRMPMAISPGPSVCTPPASSSSRSKGPSASSLCTAWMTGSCAARNALASAPRGRPSPVPFSSTNTRAMPSDTRTTSYVPRGTTHWSGPYTQLEGERGHGAELFASAQSPLARAEGGGNSLVALRADDVDFDRDATLVERFQDGDEQAFADLYERYFSRVRRYCQRRLGDPHEAEEAAQDALVRAYRALPSFGGDRRFYPWLRVIAANVCTDRCRRRPDVTLADPTAGDVVVDSVFERMDHAFVRAAMRDLKPVTRPHFRCGPRASRVAA